MMSLPKVMIAFAIVLSSILFWATSNVCRYNFAIEKKTNQLNILAQEIGISIPTVSYTHLTLPTTPYV